jgi:hypothetical protein
MVAPLQAAVRRLRCSGRTAVVSRSDVGASYIDDHYAHLLVRRTISRTMSDATE